MDAPGNTMLKVPSIIYIVLGGLCALAAIFVLIAGSYLASSLGDILGPYGALVGSAFGGIVGIILLIPTAIYLVIGIIGVKKCATPSAALFFIIVGFIFGIFSLISLITSGDALSIIINLIGIALAVLYIVGGFMNKNASAPAATA